MVTENYTRTGKYIKETDLPRLADYIVYSDSEDDEEVTSGINWGDEMPFNYSHSTYNYRYSNQKRYSTDNENEGGNDWAKRFKEVSYQPHGRNVWIEAIGEALLTYFFLASFIIIGIIVVVKLWEKWTARRRNSDDFIKLTVSGQTFYGGYNHGILGRYARLTKLTELLRTQLKKIIRVRLLWESIVVVANDLLMFRIFRQEREYIINADECYDIFKLWLGDYFYGIPTIDWHRCLKSVRSFFEWSEIRKHFDTAIIHTKSFMKGFPAAKTYELDIYPHISELILGIMFEVATGLRLDKKRHGSDRKYMNSVKDLHEIMSRRMYDPWWRLKWFSKDRKRERECCDNIYKKLSKLYSAELNNTDLAGPEDKKNLLEHILSTEYCDTVPEECVKNMIEFTVFNGHETLTTIICFVLQALAWNKDLQDAVYAQQRAIFLSDVEDGVLQNINLENVDPNNFEEELVRDPTEIHFRYLTELDKIIVECLRAFPPFPILYKETTQRFAWTNKTPQESPEPATPLSAPDLLPPLQEELDQEAIMQAIQEQLRGSTPEKKFEAYTKVWLHIYAYHRILGKDGFDKDNCLNSIRRGIPLFVFGDGKRSCPGMRFALFVIRIVVTYILSRFQIVKVIDEKDIKLVAGTVLRAEGGHPIKLVPRTMSKNYKWKKQLNELKKKYGKYDSSETDKARDAKLKEVEQKLKKKKRQSSPQPESSRQIVQGATPEHTRQSDDAASSEEETRPPQSVQSASTSREGIQLEESMSDESRLRNRMQRRKSSESHLSVDPKKSKSKKGNRKKRR